MFGASASHASNDAPWCAVINLGMGDARWDCRYRTVRKTAFLSYLQYAPVVSFRMFKPTLGQNAMA
jgi:hypothetical protein